MYQRAIICHQKQKPSPAHCPPVQPVRIASATISPGRNILGLPGMQAGQPETMEVIMTMSTRNTGKAWTNEDVALLRQLARENTPTRVIGLKLGRTEEAVYAKASELGISLKPTNQSPYNRQK